MKQHRVVFVDLQLQDCWRPAAVSPRHRTYTQVDAHIDWWWAYEGVRDCGVMFWQPAKHSGETPRPRITRNWGAVAFSVLRVCLQEAQTLWHLHLPPRHTVHFHLFAHCSNRTDPGLGLGLTLGARHSGAPDGLFSPLIWLVFLQMFSKRQREQ